MGMSEEERLRKTARIRYASGFACLFAYAAFAGPEKPLPGNTGARVKIDEQPPSRILYFEESGGLITPVAKPPPGSVRQQDPLPPIGNAGSPIKPRSPVAQGTPPDTQSPGGKTAAGKPAATATAPLVPPAPAPSAAASVPLASSPPQVITRSIAQPPAPRAPTIAKPTPAAAPMPAAETQAAIPSEQEMRATQRRDYEALIEKLASQPLPAEERARRIEEALGPQIEAYRDAATATRLGWLWTDGKNPGNAALWFQRARSWHPADDEATRGLAIASLAGGSYQAAIAIATQLPATAPARSEIQREGWIGVGQDEYKQRHYPDAISAFDRAEVASELPRHVRMLREWSRIKAGDPVLAAANFGILYRESPDLESAQGLLTATGASGTVVDAQTAASEPMASLIRSRAAESAFGGRRYLEARALDAARWDGFGASGTANASAALGRREKTGEGGLGKLAVNVTPGVELGAPIGDSFAVSASSDRLRLNANERQAGAIVGSAPAGVALPASGSAIRSTVRETQAKLRYENGIAIQATVGSGVEGGAVDAKPVGSIGVFANPEWGQIEARSFAEPVRESILSWAGMNDPHGGPAWGGVRRLGADARLLYLGFAPFSAGLYVRGERLVGTGVADNSRRAADFGFGRDLGLPGFAYASIGINAGIDAYRRNLSHYTYGQGGYFSPQSYRKAGLAFDFMTEERKSWLLRGRLSAARTWKREDPSPFLPLAPDGRSFDGSHTKGHEASARIAGVVQASPRVQIGMMVGRGISPQYSEKTILLEVRILLDPRRGAVSSDLPAARGE